MPGRIRWRLRHGKGAPSVWLLASFESEETQLELINGLFLKWKYYEDHPLRIYALVTTFEEAEDYLVEISNQACQVGMEGRLREYLVRI